MLRNSLDGGTKPELKLLPASAAILNFEVKTAQVQVVVWTDRHMFKSCWSLHMVILAVV